MGCDINGHTPYPPHVGILPFLKIQIKYQVSSEDFYDLPGRKKSCSLWLLQIPCAPVRGLCPEVAEFTHLFTGGQEDFSTSAAVTHCLLHSGRSLWTELLAYIEEGMPKFREGVRTFGLLFIYFAKMTTTLFLNNLCFGVEFINVLFLELSVLC